MVSKEIRDPDAAQRRRWIGYGAAFLALALVLAAVIWPGYDTRSAPRDDPDLWVIRAGTAEQYGRINTEVLELETVKSVGNPSTILQTEDSTLVFVDGNRRFYVVDPKTPSDLSADSEEFVASPDGTRRVAVGGGQILFVTESGALFAAPVESPESYLPINPDGDVKVAEGETPPVYLADDAAITPDGVVVAVQRAGPSESRLIVADASTGKTLSDQTLEMTLGDGAQVAQVDGKWVVLNGVDGLLWVEGRPEAIEVAAEGSPLLRTSGTGDILVADSTGLLMIDPAEGESERILTTALGSKAARPTQVGEDVYAAWLVEGDAGGTLWSSATGETTTLSYGGETVAADADPRFVTNGVRGALTDTKTGWAWTAPDGELVPSSQLWSQEDEIVEEVVTAEVKEVIEPKPPVAEPDAFGVRAGGETVLPVLLNDHDPNGDVLSIVPASVTGLDPTFGTVWVANDFQQLVVKVASTAQGSATFTYKVTDGTTPDGLTSNAATVTLTVMGEKVQNAPQWCGVEDCLATWPTPTVAPGESVTTQVLEAWVDPEGDPLYLAEVNNPSGVGAAVSNPDGTITFRDDDPTRTVAQDVPLEVVVADANGQTSKKTMNVRVTPDASVKYTPQVALGVVGQDVAVDLSANVSSGNGPVKLVEVTPENPEDVEVTPSKTGLRFTLRADAAGSYPVRVTLTDDVSEVSGTARIILLAPQEAQVATTPTTVFLRPSEDVTVDVLPTVSNPAGHVLMVDDVEYRADGKSELSVNVLGQRYVHATGDTATGQPGKLGAATYRISDGSGSPQAEATGTITFMLLPEADQNPPIASDRWVTVNAGTQVDFPVLDWAVAPAGSQIALDAGSVVNDQGEGLVFGTPTLVRYLAPSEPGEYSVGYTIYRLGDPSLQSTARLRIEVVEPSAEAKPHPVTLEGRVLAGSETSITPDYTQASMRGGAYRLSSIPEQPDKGAAALSADGQAIVYTAFPDQSGQDQFTYEVVNSVGQKATAAVKVGILDAQAPPTPVTFSDYVQMSLGSDSEVAIYPTSNDEDPLGEGLELVDVVPNAAEGSSEYDELRRRIQSVDEETGEVRLLAGNTLGTSSFIYTARGPRGDTATGLIVTKVVQERIPDLPVVSDTVLTAETLAGLPGGVDVLEGRVQWHTGDASDLKLSMWDPALGYEAEGASIKGPVPDKYTIVPFEVNGTSFLGEEASSYGFLKIPTQKEVPLALRAATEWIEVDEGGSISLDLNEAIAVPEGETLEVDAAGVFASGARPAAVCYATGQSLVYEAGKGAPWQDTCTVPVKTGEQDTYTHLAIGVRVNPLEAQPTLLPATITVSPGQSAQYDLKQMVQWDGEPNWAGLSFNVSPASELFEVTQNGSLLTVRGRDAATPTRVENVTVSLPSHPDAPMANLSLVVGPRPTLLPKGGSVVKECSQSGGATSCLISVIGAPGQANPFPTTPLKLVGAVSPGDCKGVVFEVADAQTVRATWAPDTPGGACRGGFVVEDAQGVPSSGDRQGVILLNLLGLPVAPASVQWTGYTEDSVTFEITPGAASHPAVSEVIWSGGGQKGTCALAKKCVVGRLKAGEKQEFTFRSVNAVGESKEARSVEAWAYRSPSRPTGATWQPVKNGDDGGLAKITVSAAADTKEISLGGNLVAPVVNGVATFDKVPVANDVTTTFHAVPISSNDVPPIAGGSVEGDSLLIAGVHGVGAPSIRSFEVIGSGTTARVDYSVDSRSPGRTGVRVELAKNGRPIYQGTASYGSHTVEVKYGENATFTLTAWNTFDGVDFGAAKAEASYEVSVPSPVIRYAKYTLVKDSEKIVEIDEPDYFVWREAKLDLSATCQGGSPEYKVDGAAVSNGAQVALPLRDAPQVAVRCVSGGSKSDWVTERLTGGPEPFDFQFETLSGEPCPKTLPKDADSVWEGSVPDELLSSTPLDENEWEFGWKYSLKDGYRFDVERDVTWYCVLPLDPNPGGEGSGSDSG